MYKKLGLDNDFSFLRNECDLTFNFLKNGIDIIRNIEYPNKGKLLLALMQLSQGFERFLKILYILIYKQKENKYPTNKDIKSYSHNLEQLFNKITEEAESLSILNEYLQKVRNQEEPYTSIISVLSEFAKISRYYNLDMLTSSHISYDSPIKRWHNEVEISIIQNKKWHYSEAMIEKMLDLDDISMVIHSNYNDDIIDSNALTYLIGQQQKIISQYSKLYLCHLAKGLVKVLNDIKHPYSSLLDEFFTCFYLPDNSLKKRKTLLAR